ncbi:MAG: hypothetical protein MZV70_55740 [Desulfobacterales bacterium]|nr:hypothetical protein [Desulfobacterales bacterium]
MDLKKLQSWLGKIRKLDFYGATLAAEAEKRLQDCEALLETYAQRVFEAHDEEIAERESCFMELTVPHTTPCLADETVTIATVRRRKSD